MESRAARFFMVHDTKNGKNAPNLPNDHKIYQMTTKYEYQMVTKYTKWPQNMNTKW
jgi:hypothetical protein